MREHEPCCNLCGCRKFKTVEEESSFRVLRCRQCSLVFVYPHPIGSELKQHYDEDYYAEWINTQRQKRVSMWKKRLKRVQRSHSGVKLLDVGCGEGAFLDVAQKAGWEVSGTELSSYAAKYARDILGADIFCGQLFEAQFADRSFDVVTMWHVLEHVTNPKRYLAEVKRVLRPDGLLVIAVPNVNDLIMQIAYRIIKRRKLKLFSRDDKEVHLFHFSPKTIKAYLDKTGFNCLKISPDFGIVENTKKLINMISVIPYYLAGIKIFNAIEIFATPKKD